MSSIHLGQLVQGGYVSTVLATDTFNLPINFMRHFQTFGVLIGSNTDVVVLRIKEVLNNSFTANLSRINTNGTGIYYLSLGT